MALVEGAGLAVDGVALASREDLFDRTLADENMSLVASENEDIRRRSKSNGISSILWSRLGPEAVLELDVL